MRSMRIWHQNNLTQATRRSFVRNVATVEEGGATLKLLEEYDVALGDAVVWNANGLVEFDGGEWVELYDAEGRDIGEVMNS